MIEATKIYARFATEVYDDFGDVDSYQEYYRKEHVEKELRAMKRALWMAMADKYKERTCRFGLLAYHYACEGDNKDSKKTKCTRIAGLCEVRERKCLEKAKEFE